MNSKFKKIFKLTNWKRILILFFTFICGGLFVGLSFGMKSNQNLVSNDYKNGLQVVVAPKDNIGMQVDKSLTNQLLYNLKNRLENNYPNKHIEIENNNNVFDIKITDINSNEAKKNFLDELVNKNAITLTALEGKYEKSFYQDSIISNDVFNNAIELKENSYKLNMNSDTSFNVWKAGSNLKDNPSKKILLWKNFDIFKRIANNDPDFGSTYDYNYYSYLYEDGLTPEKKEKLDSSVTNQPVLLKREFYDEVTNKTYTPYDFLVSKNDLSEFKSTTSLQINKDFGDKTNLVSDSEVKKEFYNIEYWISSYQYNDYVSSFYSASQGTKSYTFLVIALVSFFAIVSIFVVINYGYLGIIALLLMSVIVFLSLLFITMFIGNYDTISIAIILLSTIISFDFVVVLLEKFKREFLKGNSIEKSIKNSIQASNKSAYFKSFVLIIINTIIYAFLSTLLSSFSILTLIISVFIPIVMVLLFRAIIRIAVGISYINKDSKLIGFWNKKYNVESTNGTLSATVVEQVKNNNNVMVSKFQAVNKKGFVVFIVTFVSVILSAIVIFLVGFFNNGKTLSGAFNTTDYDNNKIVLNISKEGNESLQNPEINGIKKYLLVNSIDEKNIKVRNNNFIQVILDQNYSQEKINSITSNLISNYGLRVIQSQLINSNTYKVMQYEFYAILIAIVAMCVFVLFWQGWAKALSLLFMSLISMITFIVLTMFGLITINPLFCLAIIFSFTLFALLSINVTTKISNAIRKIRIEEMTKDSINKIVNNSIFRSMRSLLKILLLELITMFLFTIFVGALPISFTIFMFGFAILNFVSIIFILPKLIAYFETIRARSKRNKILNNYWETDKVKEQTFSGINNIK